MQKECVTPEIAKKLKILGFDEQCLHYYDPEDEFCSFEYFDCDRTNSSLQSDYGGIKECTAPLWQQAIRWLREIHNIIIIIDWGPLSEKYSYEIYYKSKDYDGEYVNAVYEDGLKEGLKRALEIVEK